MNDTPRVVVTGLGAVTPLGNSIPELWEGVLEGKSAAETISRFDASAYPVRFAAEVRDFDPLRYFDRKEARRTDRVIQYTLAAALEAQAMSGIEITPENADRVGVVIGSGFGGVDTISQGFAALARGPERVSPFVVPMMIANMPAGIVAIRTGARGVNYAPVSACATGGQAIGEAAAMIRRGDADVMFAGGCEAPISPLAVAAFANAGVVSARNDDPTHASRPFDLDRDGFLLGEGAGVVILERLDHALARGATIYGELIGYGATSDAFHITSPHREGEGLQRAMQFAMQAAHLQPEEIDYINAHGTSTPMNDRVEALAIGQIFGERASTIPVSSNKSQFGHLCGAAGSVEAIITLLAIREGVLPATINYQTPDPDCPLDVVPNTPRKQQIETALSNSMGFGGHNVVLALRKYR
jgi:3-oxoacyl-[acyl-carrier-protein] synthase II